MVKCSRGNFFYLKTKHFINKVVKCGILCKKVGDLD